MNWPAKKVAAMCDWIAEGFSMRDTARLMKCTDAELKREWRKVCDDLGPQAI